MQTICNNDIGSECMEAEIAVLLMKRTPAMQYVTQQPCDNKSNQ